MRCSLDTGAEAGGGARSAEAGRWLAKGAAEARGVASTGSSPRTASADAGAARSSSRVAPPDGTALGLAREAGSSAAWYADTRYDRSPWRCIDSSCPSEACTPAGRHDVIGGASVLCDSSARVSCERDISLSPERELYCASTSLTTRRSDVASDGSCAPCTRGADGAR